MEITGYKDKHEWEGSTVYLMDCMEALPQYPAGWFDLACVDPPYGIGAGRKKSYHANALTNYSGKKWDSSPPNDQYFNLLFDKTTEQIIWGGNYFNLPPKPKWIVWDKKQPEGIDQAMFELAWQSQEKIQAKIYRQSATSNSNNVSNNKHLAQQYIRIHPTQKPVSLYSWIYHNYLPQGGKVLDTHLGSASNRIAAHKAGNIEFTGLEIDEEYFYAGVKRFEQYARQLKLF
jgi:site-specific DNA-methyltransferase (adenine-specific)